MGDDVFIRAIRVIRGLFEGHRSLGEISLCKSFLTSQPPPNFVRTTRWSGRLRSCWRTQFATLNHGCRSNTSAARRSRAAVEKALLTWLFCIPQGCSRPLELFLTDLDFRNKADRSRSRKSGRCAWGVSSTEAVLIA